MDLQTRLPGGRVFLHNGQDGRAPGARPSERGAVGPVPTWIPYLCLFAASLATSLASTPLARRIALRLGAVDRPSKRRINKKPIPRMGGIAIFLGIVAAFVVQYFGTTHLHWPVVLVPSPKLQVNYWMLVVAFIVIFLTGLADDYRSLKPLQKLFGQVLAAVVAVAGGLVIGDIADPFQMRGFIQLGWLAYPVTVVYLVAYTNIINLIDGLDGLASGIVAIGGIAFAIYSYILARTSPSYASMATLIDVALVGICVGFILHNWHPAKLFMGDSGSMLLGYLVTCASIVLTGRFDPAALHARVYLPVFMPIMLPVLVLFLPVLDMCLAIVRRLSHGQSPMHPDRMHLHHRMLRIGHSVRSAVAILWGWAALIAFGSIMTLFFRLRWVLLGMVIGSIVLAFVTLWPHYRRRIAEIHASGEGVLR